jgi:small-conductance mechanosensitive channel
LDGWSGKWWDRGLAFAALFIRPVFFGARVWLSFGGGLFGELCRPPAHPSFSESWSWRKDSCLYSSVFLQKFKVGFLIYFIFIFNIYVVLPVLMIWIASPIGLLIFVVFFVF